MSTSTTPRTKTMLAWRKHVASTEPQYEQIPIPPCPSTGYLVKLLASGVCHSDHALLNIPPSLVPPHFNDTYTLGHEGCGAIVEVGVDVDSAGSVAECVSGSENRRGPERYQVGDVVALLSVPGCGGTDCPECSRDLAMLCVRGVHHGLGQDGFYAEFVAVGPRSLVRVPQGVPPPVAAVATDAVLTAYHGVVRRAEVKRHETVFLFGLGGLGFNALQIVHRAIGARVIVSDVREERLEEAARLGVPRDDIVPVGMAVQDFVKKRKLSGKIDTALDFVGKNQTFADGQVIVRIGGKILCVGTLDDQNTIQMRLGTRKRLQFLFTYGGLRQDLFECLDWIARGIIDPQVETARIEDFPNVLKDLCDGKIKSRVALLHGRDALSKL